MEASPQRTAALKYELELLKLELKDRKSRTASARVRMRKVIFEPVPAADGAPAKHLAGDNEPPGRKIRRLPLAHPQA